MKLNDWLTQYDIQDTEKAILATVMLYPELYPITAKHLKPTHFFLFMAQQVWEAMQHIQDDGLTIDTLSVIEYGKKHKKTYDDGMIFELLQHVTSTENVPYHAATVIEFYHRRLAGNSMMEALANIGRPEKPLVDILATVEQSFDDIRTTRTASKTSYDRLHEHMDAVEKRQQTDGYTGLLTGISEIDTLYQGQIEPGTLNIIAGRPGTGKTAAAGRVIINMATAGLKVGWFSLELSESACYNRYAAQYTGIPMQLIRNGMMNEKQYKHYMAKMQGFAGITDNIFESYKRGLSSDDIRNQMYSWHAQGGLDVVFIDYLQLLNTPPRYRDLRYDLQIGNMTADLRSAAGELKIPIIALAQLNREVEKRNSPKPTLADLAQSGKIEQDADTVAFLYRPDDSGGRVCWYLAKSRNGQTGLVTLTFKGDTVDIIGTPPRQPVVTQNGFMDRSAVNG